MLRLRHPNGGRGSSDDRNESLLCMQAHLWSIGGVAELRVGDVLEVEVEKGVYRGLGLARHEGRVLFVRRGLAGDRLRVRIDSLSAGYARASVLALVRPGPGRRESPCAYFEHCGGCAYQPLEYDGQLALKEQLLREALARARVPWDGPVRTHGSAERAWRTRASFHVHSGPRGVALGLREEGTHRVVDLPHCLQLSSEMNDAYRAFARVFADRPDLARRIRDVDLLESVEGSQRIAVLDGDLDVTEAASLSSLADRVPQLTGLGALLGRAGRRRFLALRGEPYVESRVLGLKLRCHARSFFQANRFLVEDLARTVVELVGPGGRVADLYAGVGLFALPLARNVDEVAAVEHSAFAAADAEANAEAAGLRNLRVRKADVVDGLASWRAEAGERIVLDPPRTGAGAEIVRAVAARGPAAVVYVACDPATLARDLQIFETFGYRPTQMHVLDLFPDTLHLETIVRLTR
jgi:23S rRNA (uracil1939-C5)-methyltransferase